MGAILYEKEWLKLLHNDAGEVRQKTTIQREAKDESKTTELWTVLVFQTIFICVISVESVEWS